MHGCFSPVLIYGFREEMMSNRTLVDDWVYEHFPGVQVFATEVIRLHMCHPCYGIPCSVDSNGDAELSAEKRATVDSLFKEYMKYHEYPGKYTDDWGNTVSAPHFMLALSGDYQKEQEEYDLGACAS
jgi:hypothetical protein